MKFFTRPVFRNYLLSYFVFFFIPLLLFSGLYFGVISPQIYNSAMQSTTDALLVEQNLLNNTMNNNNGLAVLIASRDEVTGADPDSVLSQLEVISLLNMLAQSNTDVQEIFLWDGNSERYYTSLTTFTDADILSVQYHVSEAERETFHTALQTATSFTILPAISCNNEDVLTFVYCLSASKNLSLGITIRCSDLLRTEASVLDTEVQLLLDENGMLLFHIGNPSIDFSSVIASTEPLLAMQTVSVQSTPYLVQQTQTDELAFTYVSIVKESDIYSEVRHIHYAIGAMVLASLLMFAIAVVFSLRKNYYPLHFLGELSNKILLETNVTQAQEADELKKIEVAITSLNLHSQQLKQENTVMFDRINTVSKYYFIRTLLSSDYNETLITNLMEEFNIQFQHEYFAIVVLKVNTKRKHNLYMEMMAEYMRGVADCFYSTEQFNTKYIFLVNFQDIGIYSNDLPLVLKEGYRSIRQKFGVSITVGISREFTDLSHVSNAVIEGDSSLDYALVYNEEAVISAKNISEYVLSSLDYPFAEIDKLQYLIRNASSEEVKQQVHLLFTFIDERTPLYFAKRLSYNIVNVFVEYINSIQKIENVETLAYSLLQFANVQQLKENLILLVDNLYDEYKINAEQDLSYRFASYVQAHAFDSSLSIQMMAHEFHMHISTASTLFKQFHDQTFTQYLTTLRMEKAKELLQSNQYKISDISHMVGFENHTSFIRRFRQYYNMTPSQMANDTNHTAKKAENKPQESPQDP